MGGADRGAAHAPDIATCVPPPRPSRRAAPAPGSPRNTGAGRAFCAGADLTALENLMVAQHNSLMQASGYTFLGLIGAPGFRRAETEAIDRARYWLDRIGLTGRADDAAGNLPYGDQRRLEIARAMCSEPVLLCLDEPAAGLNARESDELSQLLLAIRKDHGTSVLLIEHDMKLVMDISDHIFVVNQGTPLAEGKPAEVRDNPAVIKAYLGES